MLKWNVWVGNFNTGKIEVHNVFSHWSFWEDCCKNRKKNAVRGREDRDAFEEQLRQDLMYYYWSKCEWEVVIQHWPGGAERFKDKKIDVYDQIDMNWTQFTDYVWEHRMDLKAPMWEARK